MYNGSFTYGVAKELTKILKPFIGKSPHHINSTNDFVEQDKHINLTPGECLSSYDVSALFTLVPVDPALKVIKDLLEKRPHSQGKNSTPCRRHNSTIRVLCPNTYFSFQGQFYEQIKGASMASPVSPIVANLYMGYFEQRAFSAAPHPRFWHRNVDDTFVIQKEIHKQDFLQHINSVDPAIQFAVENNKEDGAIPLLDTIVKPEADGKLSTTVCRNLPTLTSSYSGTVTVTSQPSLVLFTPSHRVQTVCSNPELLHKEKTHLRNALIQFKYSLKIADPFPHQETISQA